MRVLITGATGFIGRAIVESRCVKDEIFVLTRRPGRARKLFNGLPQVRIVPLEKGYEFTLFQPVDAVINLAGESLAGYWTPWKKSEIVESRVKFTEKLVEKLASQKKILKVWIQASAVGYYGCSDEEKDESSSAGDTFTAWLCQEWEGRAHRAKDFSERVAIFRFGAVLGRDGGLIARFLPLLKRHVAVLLGSGKQWISWIHREDVVRLTEFVLDERKEGVFNVVSPHPVRMEDFISILASVSRARLRLKVPSFAVKVMFGRMGKEMLLCSSRIYPGRLLSEGFSYRYPELEEALRTLFSV